MRISIRRKEEKKCNDVEINPCYVNIDRRVYFDAHGITFWYIIPIKIISLIFR